MIRPPFMSHWRLTQSLVIFFGYLIFYLFSHLDSLLDQLGKNQMKSGKKRWDLDYKVNNVKSNPAVVAEWV